jgi:hypothetical protein
VYTYIEAVSGKIVSEKLISNGISVALREFSFMKRYHTLLLIKSSPKTSERKRIALSFG